MQFPNPLFQLLCIVSVLRFSSGAIFNVSEPFQGTKYASIPGARALFLDTSGDILVLSQIPAVIALTETPYPNGSIRVDQSLILNGAELGINLNHGLTHSEGYLYASTTGTVYRWPYEPGTRQLIRTPPEIVISGIPSGGSHVTRSLLFDDDLLLYVHVGAFADVDQDSRRSKIRRFNISGLNSTSSGIDFETGEVFADGVRNEVGFTFDSYGVLWGVENAANELYRPDLGIDFGYGNPAEELNRFEKPGEFYGYPYCFSSYLLETFSPGSQFAWPSFMDENGTFVVDDDWCRNVSNNKPPALALPDHSAPLGISFYTDEECNAAANSSSVGAFPCELARDAFVAFHGAYPLFFPDARPPTGYSVKWFKFDKRTGMPTGEDVDVIYEPDPANCLDTAPKCFRPVNAIFDGHGHLVVSMDISSEIFKVYYNATPPEIIYGNVVGTISENQDDLYEYGDAQYEYEYGEIY